MKIVSADSLQPVSWQRNLFCIWLGQLLAMAGMSMIIPFIPIYLREVLGFVQENQRAWATSLFYSLGMLVFCIANPLWGALGDRCGRKLMLLRAYFVTAVTFPTMVFMPNFTLMLIMRVLTSMFSGTVAAAQALAAVTTPDKHQGFALGCLSAAFWSGNMLGMLAGGVIVHYCGYVTAFMLCGALFLGSGFLTLFFVKENFVPPELPTPSRQYSFRFKLPEFDLAVWLLLGVMFILPMARRCDEPYLSFLVELVGGLDHAAINTSWVTAAAALGGILSGTTFGRLSDRWPPVILLIPALAGAGAFMLIQALSNSLWQLAMARFMIFFAAGGLEPVFLSMLSHTVKPELRGTAFGWSASFRMFGGMMGALLGGAVVAHWGTRSVFFTGAALMFMFIFIMVPAVKMVEKINRNKGQKNPPVN